jgi:hypothetical protein
MTSEAKTPVEYINSLPEDRKIFVKILRSVILKNLPKGFHEGMNYGKMVYYVPHSIYPKGYHCKPTDPLPFMGIACQKNNINFYQMGIYANAPLYDWFVAEYPKYSSRKLDMGKSCIRLKKFDKIPFDLIGELMTKISVEDWIAM